MKNCKEIEVLICSNNNRIPAVTTETEIESLNEAASKQLALIAFMADLHRSAVSAGNTVELTTLYQPAIYPGYGIKYLDNYNEKRYLIVLSITHTIDILANKALSGTSKIVGTLIPFGKFTKQFDALQRGDLA